MTVASTLTLRYTISNNGGVHYTIPMRIQTKDDITIDLIQTGTTTTLDPAKYSISAITESSFLLSVVQTGDIPLAPDMAEVRLMWPLERTVDYPSGTISSTEFNANGDSEVIGTMARIQDSTRFFLALDPYDSRWANTGVDRYPTADYDSGKDLAITMKWGDQPKWTELATGADLVALQAEVDTNKAGVASNVSAIATNVTDIASATARVAANEVILDSYTFPSSNNLFELSAGVHPDAPMIAMGLFSGLDASYYSGFAGTSGASFISYHNVVGTFGSVQQAIDEFSADILTNESAIATNLDTLRSYSFPTANNLFGAAAASVNEELPMKAMGLLSGQDVPFYTNELHHSGAGYISTVDSTVSPPTYSNVQTDLSALQEEIVSLKARLDALEA